MYMCSIKMGVIGLLVILNTRGYGEIAFVVGNFVMLSLE